MKKLLFSLFAVLFFFVGSSVVSASEISEAPDSDSTFYIDPDLVGTSIDVSSQDSQSPGIVSYMDGYLYKYISHTETNVKKTYLGKVLKTPSISFGFSTKNGYVTLGGAYSESREYYEYSNSSKVVSKWGVYNKYSGNYMFSETLTSNPVYKSYARVK